MQTDPIADLFSQIRNALAKNKPFIEVPHSGIKQAVAELLKNEGYLTSLFVSDDNSSPKKTLKITLKYNQGKPVISHLRRISKPGQRIYLNSRDLPHVLNGFGIAVVSTSKGLMTAHQARAMKIGGEVICEVY